MVMNAEGIRSFAAATMVANRYTVTVFDGAVRVAFGMAIPGEVEAQHFHSAVMLSTDDAAALGRLLLTLAQKGAAQ